MINERSWLWPISIIIAVLGAIINKFEFTTRATKSDFTSIVREHYLELLRFPKVATPNSRWLQKITKLTHSKPHRNRPDQMTPLQADRSQESLTNEVF